MRNKIGLARFSFGLAVLSAVFLWIVEPLTAEIEPGLVGSIGVLLSVASVASGVLSLFFDRESRRWAVAAVVLGVLVYLSFGYWFNSQLGS